MWRGGVEWLARFVRVDRRRPPRLPDPDFRREARVARATHEARRGTLADLQGVSYELERRIADRCRDAIDGDRGVEELQRLAPLMRPHTTENLAHWNPVAFAAIVRTYVDRDDIES